MMIRLLTLVVLMHAGLSTEAGEMIQFADDAPWFDEVLQQIRPPVERIDVNERGAGPIRPLDVGDWTLAVWYFPAWNPGGKHWPELAGQTPLRIPLLYESDRPEVSFNGIQYYRNADPRVMDWHVKWMTENGINAVLFDWYPSSFRERFDAGLGAHASINSTIEVGFLGKDRLGGDPVATNRFAETTRFACMWTNHGNAWIPDGTMEYACRNYLGQPNYLRIDGKPLVVIHSAHNLNVEHGGHGREGLEKLRAYLNGQREIARSFGHEIHLAIGQLAPQYSNHFRAAGFDGVMNYIIEPTEEFSTEIELIDRSRPDHRGTLKVVAGETQLLPLHEDTWNALSDAWGPGHIPTLTPLEDWRHWRHLNDRLFHFDGVTPDTYERLLRAARRHVIERDQRRFAIVGIWNEFYEGAYLEPDLSHGYEYLRRVRKVFGKEHTQ